MPVLPPPSGWDLPDPLLAPPGQDLVAVGAELDPGTVWSAYTRGLFPMHLDTGELGWWAPDPRGVLPLADLRVSHSLRKSLRRFTVSVDGAFRDVMSECADARRDQGWITEEFVDTYCELHRLGWAHSVEVWDADGVLVGGLYGVSIGGLFAGESMFHRVTDASKTALVALVDVLGADGRDRLLDVQWRTDHLASLGAVEVPRVDYVRRLREVLEWPSAFL